MTGIRYPSISGSRRTRSLFSWYCWRFWLVSVSARFWRGLKKREDFIRRSLEEAQRNRQQAEERLREYETKLDHARMEATEIVEEARRDAEVVRKRIEQEARQNSDAMIDRARRDINLARDHALQSLFDRTAELAASLAAAALARQMSPEEHQRLVHDSLREIQSREEPTN